MFSQLETSQRHLDTEYTAQLEILPRDSDAVYTSQHILLDSDVLDLEIPS
ncbi:5842_t:CDS:2 [Racocetra persica]|uniref:5842_t:CDS:1 n=1 Tax=Racocetra persica TaxID=160502 RepID=A0ACA9PNB3_9GLOM|nr:5842_t:CDS:2 [Racocetra persica]